MKKRIIAMSTVVLFVLGTTASAAVTNEGVSTQNPADISEKGTSKPSEVWDFSTKEEYGFDGKADSSTLYSNVLFTGADSVEVYCYNHHDSEDLTVRLMRDDVGADSVLYSKTIPPNTGATWTVSTMNSSEYFYIEFFAPSNFEGHINKN